MTSVLILNILQITTNTTMLPVTRTQIQNASDENLQMYKEKCIPIKIFQYIDIVYHFEISFIIRVLIYGS